MWCRRPVAVPLCSVQLTRTNLTLPTSICAGRIVLSCGASPITLAMGDPGEVVVDGVPLRRWSLEEPFTAAPNLYGHSHAALQNHAVVDMPPRESTLGPWRAGSQKLYKNAPPPPGSTSDLIGEQLRWQGRRQPVPQRWLSSESSISLTSVSSV